MSAIQVECLRLSQSNCFLIRGERAILVDTGSPKDFAKLCKALTRRGISPADLSLILLTHGHADHAGSVGELKQNHPAVPVALHIDDAAMVRQGCNATIFPTGRLGVWLHRFFAGATMARFEPDVLAVFDTGEEWSLAPYGVDGVMVKTPGHTPGSVSVLLSDGQAIVGDLLAGGFLNVIMRRKATLPIYVHHEDIAQCLEDVAAHLREFLARGYHTFYVGHGGPLDRQAVQKFVDQLRQHLRQRKNLALFQDAKNYAAVGGPSERRA